MQFIVGAPFGFTAANIFSAVGNTRLGLSGRNKQTRLGDCDKNGQKSNNRKRNLGSALNAVVEITV